MDSPGAAQGGGWSLAGGGESGGGAGAGAGPAEARACVGLFKARRAQAPTDSGFLAPLLLHPAAPGASSPTSAASRPPQPPGRKESPRPRRQLVNMATPTGPRVPCSEAAVARALLFGWVLVRVAGATGEWHPPPTPSPGARHPEEGGRSWLAAGSPCRPEVPPARDPPRLLLEMLARGVQRCLRALGALAVSLGKELPREPTP